MLPNLGNMTETTTEMIAEGSQNTGFENFGLFG